MLQKTYERMTRRRFLRIAASSILTMGLFPAFLQECAPEDVEKVIEPMAELALLINEYRKQNGLPEIPVSPKLTTVALKHLVDLNTYHPEDTCGDQGNLHSWSNNGNWQGKTGEGAWQGCCYPDDHSNAACMWDKPKEIVDYPGEGLEITHWESGVVTAQSTLASWQTSTLHNDVILTQQWQALGAAHGGNYACAWFGKVKA